MSTFTLIFLCVVGGGFVLSWLVGRFNSMVAAELSITTQIVVYGVAVAYLVDETRRAAERSGWFIVLAGVLALAALMTLILAVVRLIALWLALTGQVSGDGEVELRR